MCLLPYSRASMDHIPGPIIATVMPKPARMIVMKELPGEIQNFTVSAMAIVIPATGVHNPKSKSTPATAASTWRTFGVGLAVPKKLSAAK